MPASSSHKPAIQAPVLAVNAGFHRTRGDRPQWERGIVVVANFVAPKRESDFRPTTSRDGSGVSRYRLTDPVRRVASRVVWNLNIPFSFRARFKDSIQEPD